MKQSTDHALGKGRASNKGNTRTAGKEQYYTPPITALSLVDTCASHIPDLSQRTLIEPAAGTGNFLDAYRALGVESILAYDLEPKTEGITQADFLTLTLPDSLVNAVAITNPPFGRNHSLSVPFFNRLANHCSHIGFVIPKSWRKWSVQNRLDSRFHLIHDEELSIDYLGEDGKQLPGGSGGLNTIFQLWERRTEHRLKVRVQDCGLFERVKPELADISLTVFGRGCGKVKTEFDRVPNTTQMFLRSKDPLAAKALQEANLEQFYKNVAFVEALSWAEINFAVREWCEAQGVTLPNIEPTRNLFEGMP